MTKSDHSAGDRRCSLFVLSRFVSTHTDNRLAGAHPQPDAMRRPKKSGRRGRGHSPASAWSIPATSMPDEAPLQTVSAPPWFFLRRGAKARSRRTCSSTPQGASSCRSSPDRPCLARSNSDHTRVCDKQPQDHFAISSYSSPVSEAGGKRRSDRQRRRSRRAGATAAPAPPSV